MPLDYKTISIAKMNRKKHINNNNNIKNKIKKSRCCTHDVLIFFSKKHLKM